MNTFTYAGTDFPLRYCSLCEVDQLCCAKCGNNTCNGGYGVQADGEDCDLCPTAYEAAKALNAA